MDVAREGVYPVCNQDSCGEARAERDVEAAGLEIVDDNHLVLVVWVSSNSEDEYD